jgi:3-oxoacyl-[acyl-carrier-protein] synthase II
VGSPDPALPITLAESTAERASLRAVLANSFGFGGNDASLVITQAAELPKAPSDPSCALVIAESASLGAYGLASGAERARYADDDAPAVNLSAKLPEVRGATQGEARTRSDLVGRQTIALVERALVGAREPGLAGVVVGTAFPAADASTAFYARVLEKGPRFAAPATFPNLVPSAAAASASITLGARGPSLAVADLGASVFAALEVASELVRGGHAPSIVACGIEPESRVVEGSLAEACSRVGTGPRGSGGAAFRIERADACALPIARIALLATFREELPDVRAPRARSEVIGVDRDSTRALATRLGWGEVPMRDVGPRVGWHEAASALAIASALSRLRAGDVDEVLVLAAFRDRGALCLLEYP